MEFKVNDIVVAKASSPTEHECAYIAGGVYIVTKLDIPLHRIMTRSLDGKVNSWGAGRFIKLDGLSKLEKVIYNIKD